MLIGSVNVHGLGRWRLQDYSRIQTIEHHIAQQTINILALQETWLRPADSLSDITTVFKQQQRYRFFAAHRPNQDSQAHRGSGGVGLLIETKLWDKCEQVMMDSVDYECVWVKLVRADIVLHVASVYIPPVSHHRSAAVVRHRLDRLCNDVMSLSAIAPVILCGDFNCRVGTLPSKTDTYCYFRQSADTRHTPGPLDRHFASSFDACQLLLLNGLFGHTAQFTNISVGHSCQYGAASSIVDYISVSHSILNWVDKQLGLHAEHNSSLSPEHAIL